MNYITRLLAGSKIRSLLLFVLSLATFASLISYDPSDPSFNLVTDSYPSNLFLYFGSYLSDLIYQLIGISAYIIPLSFLVWSYELFRVGQITFPKTRFLFMLVSIGCAACAADYFEIAILPSRSGGILGIGLWSLIISIDYVILYKTYTYVCFALLAIIFLVIALGISIREYAKVVTFLISLINKTGVFQMLGKKIGAIDGGRAYYESAEFDRVNERQNMQSTQLVRQNISPTIEQNNDYVVKEKLLSKQIIAPQVPISNASAPRSPVSVVSRSNEDKEDLLPSIDLLSDGAHQNFQPQTHEELKQKSEDLLAVLSDFGVKGKIIDVREGPVVTMYEFEPAAGTKSSRVIGLSDDIARSLSAISTRIAVIPGRNVLGIELPNKQRMFFRLKELVQTAEFQDRSIMLPIILGKDLGGIPMVADLAKMPHLLVAGTTGSGKSVAINAMIMSLLYRYTPQECRMIMIDPKMLELSAYDNIPHLMTPVVTEPGKAVVALKWAVKEMENRYRLMSHLGVRSIANYNTKLQEAVKEGQVLERKIQTGFDPETGRPSYESVPIDMNKMPFIVVIVDEMADLMLVAGKDIETSIQRLAQMARAAGIHIIMATQRPSVDVITGVIKANFPSRISFKVTSKIDSRTILGEQGSEQLLGMGDMLYMGNSSRILRVHGPFVDDNEVEKVTNFLRSTGVPEYISAVTESPEDEILSNISGGEEEDDDIYMQAVNIVRTERKASISYIQRCLRIGYNRAANIVEAMEKNGILSAPNQSGKREVLLPED
jgi:S-DNA-T family DNA segregation ATPase FtsK/SpoIIIE